MFMKKKAQAAMEFLMTYGWAILIVLAVIATLTAFGVLNTDIFIPSRCTLGPVGVINCVDYKITTDGKIYFNIENGGGKGTLNIKSVILTGGDLEDKVCGGGNNTNYDNPTGFSVNTTVRTLAGPVTYLNLPAHAKGKFYVGKDGTIDKTLMFAGELAGGCDVLAKTAVGKKVRANVNLVYFTGTEPAITHTMQGQIVAPVEIP